MSLSTYDKTTKIWSSPSRPSIYNPDVSLGYLILNILKSTPARIIEINADDGTETSCAEMFEKSAKVCRFLSSMRLKQHDVIGIIARNSQNLTPIVFACLTLGLPINPLAPIMNESDIVYMFSKTKPKLIFCDSDLIEKVKASVDKMAFEDCQIITLMEQVEGFQFVNEIIQNADRNVDEFVIPNIPNSSSTSAFIICTSGSTSMIKGACESHKQLIVNFPLYYFETFELSKVIFYPASIYVVTTIYALLASVFCGMKRVISSKDITPEVFMDIIDEFKVTFIFFSPHLLNSVKSCKTLRPLKSVKSVLAAGMTITMDFMERCQKMFPNSRIVCAYGSTEGNLSNYIKGDAKSWSSGQVSGGYQARIVDEHGRNLGPKEKGEIWYKPPIIFSGYFGEPNKYAEAVRDGWIISGDLGYFDDEGFIFVVERIKNMLRNIVAFTSQEIEEIINEIDGVIASDVVGVFDDGIDLVYAFVIIDPSKNLTKDEIKKFVSDRVIEQKRIKELKFLKKFPMTATGKVDKRELKKIAKIMHEEK